MIVEARKICQIDSETKLKNTIFEEEKHTHFLSFFFGFPTPSFYGL